MRAIRRLSSPSRGVLGALAVALCVAACGGSSKSSTTAAAAGGSPSAGSSTTGAASGSATAAAEKIVAAHTKDPTSIGPTTPIGKTIPTGKRIVAINCGPEGCALTLSAFKAASAVLGWHVTELTPSQPTPQLIQGVFDQAVRLHPDAVVTSALPVVAFRREAAELKAAKIPLVSVYGPDPTGGPLALQIFGADGDNALARVIAAKTVADLGGKGTIATVVLSGYPIIAVYTAAYTAEVKKLCPACTFKTLTVQPTSLGTTDGTAIVNFLRANPGVNALFLGYEQLGEDLTAAAKSAGLTLPKTYSESTTTAGVQAVLNGQRTATVPADYNIMGWQIADALARSFTGQSPKQDLKYQTPVIWAKQYNDVPSGSGFPATVTGYQAQFKKLWGK